MFKTNETKDRVSYGNLLLPPEGFTLNFAVGTTYSLDLEALTAVCIALGLSEDTDSTLLQNPVSMLNALQKVSEKVLIFCEAGQIKMPGTPSALSLLLEKMIIPVALPKARGINHYPAFHPKTWVLQYVNDRGDYHYRFAVLSRNLTFDRSWDISFVMDSSKATQTAQKTRPIMDYLEFLRNQIRADKVQNARVKRSAVRKLCDALVGVSFTTDSKEFGDNFEIMPLGIGSGAYDMNNVKQAARLNWHDYIHLYDPNRTDYSTLEDNVIYINVWDWDPQWKIEVTEAGKSTPLTVTRVFDRDPLHTLTTDVPLSRSGALVDGLDSVPTSHMWKVVTSSATSNVTIKVTNRFGEVFTQEMTGRNKRNSFSVNQYIK